MKTRKVLYWLPLILLATSAAQAEGLVDGSIDDGKARSATCSACHGLIDPLGFALENFDAVGAWREFDAGAPVDSRGGMADGTAIDGVTEFRQALVARPELFAATVTEKLMIYALGRGLQHYDMPVLREILKSSAAKAYRFEDIVFGIVQSPGFRMRARSER